MTKVVESYFDEFTKKHWDKIQTSLSLNDAQAEALFRELRKLNPRPGASLGETVGRNMQQITPDFIVDTLDDGTVTFTLNNGEVPELKVSQSFVDSMKEYQQNKDHLSRQTKEALLYIKKKRCVVIHSPSPCVPSSSCSTSSLLMAMRLPCVR